MATTYSSIYDEFLDRINDPDLLCLSDDDQEATKRACLEYAVDKCKEFVDGIDLDARVTVDVDPESEYYDSSNPHEEAFEADLPSAVRVMLTQYMLVHWFQPYAHNADLLRLHMNTKDFNTTSPANLVEKIGARFDEARRRARSLRNEYTFSVNDVSTLSPRKP